MSFKELFGRKSPDLDPLADLVLSKLKVGYFVDFDMNTWEVTDYNTYAFDDGYQTQEWELTAGHEKQYLERSEDDEVLWTLSRKLPLGAIEGNISKQIIDNEDPPSQITCKGKTYYLDESGAGNIRQAEHGRQEFIYWTFIDETDEHFVTIEQWGEREFEASEGRPVEEYQFTNILPGIN